MDNYVIDAQKIKYAYPTIEGSEPKLALKGVTLTVGQGQFVAVLGHNGSGNPHLRSINVLLRAQEGSPRWSGSTRRTKPTCGASAAVRAWCSRTG